MWPGWHWVGIEKGCGNLEHRGVGGEAGVRGHPTVPGARSSGEAKQVVSHRSVA